MSQEANIDTIASFAAYVINQYIHKYGASEDLEASAATKKGQTTVSSKKKKTEELIEFVEVNMIDALQKNTLSDNQLNII